MAEAGYSMPNSLAPVPPEAAGAPFDDGVAVPPLDPPPVELLPAELPPVDALDALGAVAELVLVEPVDEVEPVGVDPLGSMPSSFSCCCGMAAALALSRCSGDGCALLLLAADLGEDVEPAPRGSAALLGVGVVGVGVSVGAMIGLGSIAMLGVDLVEFGALAARASAGLLGARTVSTTATPAPAPVRQTADAHMVAVLTVSPPKSPALPAVTPAPAPVEVTSASPSVAPRVPPPTAVATPRTAGAGMIRKALRALRTKAAQLGHSRMCCNATS
jgi:hypothetical protein